MQYPHFTSISIPLQCEYADLSVSPGYPAMPFPAGLPLPAALVRPKRKQVKMAVSLMPLIVR